jgi:hypothetical protein
MEKDVGWRGREVGWIGRTSRGHEAGSGVCRAWDAGDNIAVAGWCFMWDKSKRTTG